MWKTLIAGTAMLIDRRFDTRLRAAIVSSRAATPCAADS